MWWYVRRRRRGGGKEEEEEEEEDREGGSDDDYGWCNAEVRRRDLRRVSREGEEGQKCLYRV